MVSDNRWVATTKGIVVFLLTALLFVFWYDRDRELAESHVTAVRFGFYRVIWIEVLCGIAVAWCVRKKFRFRLPDAGVLLLGGYVLLRSVYGDGMVGYRTDYETVAPFGSVFGLAARTLYDGYSHPTTCAE